MRKLAEGIISKLLLQKVTYRMLPLLPTMQGLFQYCQHQWVKPHFIYRLFSLWADQFPLVLVQTSESGRTLTMDPFQAFSLKKSW